MSKKQKIEPMIKVTSNPWGREYARKAKYQHHSTTGTEFVITDGSDAKPVATFTSTYPVDREQFCKLYLSALEPLTNLNSSGRKVFHVLFNQIRKNIGKDMVQMAYIHTEEIKSDISLATYTRGVRDLYDNEFIKPVEGLASTWFINPDFIFNGNRLQINNTYILKESIDEDTGEIFNQRDSYAS